MFIVQLIVAESISMYSVCSTKKIVNNSRRKLHAFNTGPMVIIGYL